MKNENDGLARLTLEQELRAGLMIEMGMSDPIVPAFIEDEGRGPSYAAQADKEMFLHAIYYAPSPKPPRRYLFCICLGNTRVSFWLVVLLISLIVILWQMVLGKL